MRALVVVLSPALLCGFTPPPPGHEVTLGVGYSEYQQIRLWYTAKEAVIDAGWSYRGGPEDLFTVRTAFSTAVGDRKYIGTFNPPWQSDFAGTMSVRAGVNWRFVGLEAGVAYWHDPTDSGPVPTGAFWAGADGYAHLWVEIYPGTTIGDLETAGSGWGIGHNSEYVRAEIGMWNSNMWGYPLLVLRGAGRITDGVWVGLRGRWYRSDSWNRHETRIVLTVSVDPEKVVSAINGR